MGGQSNNYTYNFGVFRCSYTSNQSTIQNLQPGLYKAAVNVTNESVESSVTICGLNTKTSLQPENITIIEKIPVKQFYIEILNKSTNEPISADDCRVMIYLDDSDQDISYNKEKIIINSINNENNNKFEIVVFESFEKITIKYCGSNDDYCINLNDLTSNINNPVKIKID